MRAATLRHHQTSVTNSATVSQWTRRSLVDDRPRLAGPSIGARQMAKQLDDAGKFRLCRAADPGQVGMTIIGILGLGCLVAESAWLSAAGGSGGGFTLIAVFAASTVSSIADCAFSAL